MAEHEVNRRDLTDSPLVRVFESPTDRKLADFVAHEMDPDRRYRTGELADAVDATRSGLLRATNNFEKSINVGLLDVDSGEDAVTTFYVRADTEVVSLLSSWDHYPLRELLDTKARQRLLDWVLVGTNPEQSYSKQAIHRESGVSKQAVYDNLDILLAAGLLEPVEGARGTEYTVDTDSTVYTDLIELANAIAAVHTQRTRGA